MRICYLLGLSGKSQEAAAHTSYSLNLQPESFCCFSVPACPPLRFLLAAVPPFQPRSFCISMRRMN